MEELQGKPERVIFKSADGRYCVFRMQVKESGRSITVVGNVGVPPEDGMVKVCGNWTRHARFGVQFRAESMELVEPENSEEIREYLASGVIAGIGPAMAKRIVDRFGEHTLDVMDSHIEALLEIQGIGEKTLDKISESYKEVRSTRELALTLQKAGIPPRFAAQLRKVYGEDAEDVLEMNPYRMVGEVDGMDFGMVDKLALMEGIESNDEERIIHGINYILACAVKDGHCCVPESVVYRETGRLLRIMGEEVEEKGCVAVGSGEIPSGVKDGKRFLYLPYMYEAETESVYKLKRLMENRRKGSVSLSIEKFEEKHGFTLAEEQRKAVEESMQSGVLIITGGPGTGKTTLVQAIIAAAEQKGLAVRLMAPTGRAAKRLAVTSGRDADTIHRALEAEPTDYGHMFNKNEADPLDADVIIVDEASMIDMPLFYHLLNAIRDDASLILVGDVDQLPPVGPGTPLRSLIRWGKVPVVRLQHIFRQEEGSGIITNAALVREGKMPVREQGSFEIREVGSERQAFNEVMKLCQDWHYETEENKMSVQILSPMYRGLCGVDSLNDAIQRYVHPDVPEKTSHFLVGDKVMQRRNNYEKGVYNGDIGIVWAVHEGKVFVSFDEKEVVYEPEERSELQLAYAITVHKSQGSEYDRVIMILLPTQFMMLQRNLLYTGITRAAKKTVLITTEEAVSRAVQSHKVDRRYSLFLDYLTEEAIM
jgi:exodeoxyribonuclease V alpha subunit